MASRSESPEIIESSQVLGKRTRSPPNKRAVKVEVISDDDEYLPPRSDSEDSEDLADPDGISDPFEDDIDVDPKEMEKEPEQGKILWSEDREDFPHCPSYHKDVEKFAARITEIHDKIAQHLTTISNKSEGMKRLTQQAREFRTSPEPKIPVIALIGDAGTGKSSLISAVLDTPHVSKEGNFGRSCTCVITEYRKEFEQQTKKFAAKVEFLDDEQRRELLEEHIEKYILYHFQNDEDWSFEEQRDYRIEAKTAESTFSDLFRGKPQFASSEAIMEYMQTVFKNDDVAATVFRFEKWCDQLARNHTLWAETKLIEAESAFQLNKTLSPFLSSSASWNEKPSLWPIVHKVSIGVKGPRLLRNAILADLPGVSDVNKVRASTGKSYLVTSDYVWIVTPIGRAATDTSVDDLLYEYGNRFEGRLAIVCTKIDETMNLQSFAQEYPDAAETCQKIEAQIKKAKTNFSMAKAALRRVQKISSRRERQRTVDQCRATYNLLLHHRLEKMVQVRNDKVTSLLYTEKVDRLKKGDVDLVYCVSNKHYAWLKGFKEAGQEEAPQLSAEMTGILKLRQYALTISSREIWATFMNHVKHTSNGFVKALRIWATRTTTDDSSGLSGIREKSAEAVRANMRLYRQTLQEDAIEHIKEPMEEVYEEIGSKASKFVEEVRGWHYQTIGAFIRRKGTYNSRSVGKVSWNIKLALPAAKFMSTGWKEMISCEKEALATAETKIKSALDTILVEVKEPMERLKIPLGHFQGFLEAKKHGIAHAFANYREEIAKQLKIVKHLVDKDDVDGFFAQAMEPFYESAKAISGRGSKNKMIALLEDHIQQDDSDSPFVEMATLTSKAVDKCIKKCSSDLEKACLKIFDEIFLQFGCLIDEIPDDDGVVAETKLTLRNFLVDVDEEMEAMIDRLHEIEKDPRPSITKEEEKPVTPLVKAEPDASASSNTDDLPYPKKKVKVEFEGEDNDDE